MQAETITQDILLLGGGHAHALVIKKWGMRPLPGVRLTLISRDVLTPYSGMLPGLIAGHYSVQETHIDLARLCRWAGVRFIRAEIHALDAAASTVCLANRPEMTYDIVSIDTGSTPSFDNIAGAREFTTAVKPVPQFFARWQNLEQRLQQQNRALNIAVVGAGAGGFEILLAIKHRLQALGQQQHQFHWIIRDKHILSGHNARVQHLASQYCIQQGINLYTDFTVTEVESDSLTAADGSVLPIDEIFWCTQASAPEWPALAGLAVNAHGFIEVNDSLQSLSHENVFAAGDIAHQVRHPRPKAGVFAVRQGPILFENLQRHALQRPLKQYIPQRNFLSLLALGEKKAIASKAKLTLSGRSLWLWKNRIDRKFMQKFSDLPPMQQQLQAPKKVQVNRRGNAEDTMRCGGCGAKIGSSVLRSVIQQLPLKNQHKLVLGLTAADDAAVIDCGEALLVQSVDQLRSMIADPYLFARIAAVHALSDIYAMTALPHSAMALAALPYADEKIQARDLQQMMQGVMFELNKAECALAGGHSSEAAEISLGLSVNGLIQPELLTPKQGLRAEQQLILCKPIGTGVILAADMQAKAPGPVLYQCIESMLQSNQAAAHIFKQQQASALTDITGFGLLGHLGEMLTPNTQVEISLTAIPLLPGALDLSNQQLRSSLYPQNLKAQSLIDLAESWQHHPRFPLLFDPQTSGGLLAAVDTSRVDSCLQQLRAGGYTDAKVIGVVKEGNQQSVHLTD